ncbi:siroheme decarboxylase subunit beta [Methylocucumis oryzae]|uniref:siroheme decarboxylase n=1 Tax=Methylocucumis oryzae TaxID=1632867 RepID=A0A0F3IJ84_9GAMM|nr:AsnC family transcriptional regulator [Methylocucumis oryzae]KJV06732.1 protein nirL [Methylocucumis oryzae]
MLDNSDRRLLASIQQGLPLCSRPYAEIGQRLGLPETEVINRLSALNQQGLIKRMGVIVKHRSLGYQANAMVVWNIPDAEVTTVGQQMSTFPFVNLCYQRPRHPDWPYNLYCMIHGKDRETVLTQLEQLTQTLNLTHIAKTVLFSRRCFKQQGARYRLTHQES